MAARRALTFTAAAMAVLAMAGGAMARAGSEYTVTMSSMRYGNIPTNLKVGDTIVWVNRDSVPHTVTARDHSFDLHMGPGQSVKMPLQKAGSFAFYCTYHTMMRGTLTVVAK